MKSIAIFFFIFIFIIQLRAQERADSTGVTPPRASPLLKKVLIGGLSFAATTGSLYLFSKTSGGTFHKKFNVLNDINAWNQMDKLEHGYIAYTSNNWLYSSWRWTGLSKEKSLALSSASTITYLFLKEYTDGRKITWGWSWGDMGANLTGVGLFSIQEIIWEEQKVQFKFSAFPKKQPKDLEVRSNKLFGSSFLEKIIKDHNIQTYWLSFNLHTLTGSDKIPSWINLSVGYGAGNMYGPYDNLAYKKDGSIEFDRSDLKRFRQWYFSPDIALNKINTKSKILKTFLFTLNSIKIPLPTLEFSNNSLKGHYIHF